jgi:hypothetical protein
MSIFKAVAEILRNERRPIRWLSRRVVSQKDQEMPDGSVMQVLYVKFRSGTIRFAAGEYR